MAKLRVDLTEPLLNGMDIKFKAPSDCTAVDGLIVYAPDNNGGISSQVFTFKDAHGNTLTGLGNLFAVNVLVKVMVDTETGSAYIQNADTNKYLENKIANAGSKVNLSSSVSSTSTSTAANSYAVKQAYDKAVDAYALAENGGSSSEGTIGFTNIYHCAFDTSEGYYQKIGKMCFVAGRINLTADGGTDVFSFSLRGIPAVSKKSTSYFVGGASWFITKDNMRAPVVLTATGIDSTSNPININVSNTMGGVLSGDYLVKFSLCYLTE
jgi:hypothetical protein